MTIDEMDKLEPGVATEGFLNGIKQLFAVRSCSFVVSVSSSAWSTFTRRGFDVRDALDSSLDAIETLGPLDFYEVRSLIRKRGEVMTDTQVMFCYALSGGLPREALRAARNLAHANRGQGRTLQEAGAEVLRHQFEDVVAGWRQQVRSWDTGERSEGTELLDAMSQQWLPSSESMPDRLGYSRRENLSAACRRLVESIEVEAAFLRAMNNLLDAGGGYEPWAESAMMRADSLAAVRRETASSPARAWDDLQPMLRTAVPVQASGAHSK